MLAALRARASAVATRLPSVMQLGSPLAEQRRGMHFPYRVGVGHSERLIMMRNMVTSLIEHERIKTTFRKGKMVARLADRLINKAKKGGVTNRRRIQSYVKTPSSLAKLYTSECNCCSLPSCCSAQQTLTPAPLCSTSMCAVLADRYEHRRGGYTRVLRTYPRMGDQADMAFVELVDRPLLKMPWPLPEQPTSVMPGRGGRAFRAGKRDLRDEIRGGRS